MNNFLTWLSSYKKTDCFFPEEKEMIELFKEYAGKGVDVANE